MNWRYDLRCAECGRFMRRDAAGSAWWATGEHGEDTEVACAPCAAKPAFRLIAGNGSTSPRWCGRVPLADAGASPALLRGSALPWAEHQAARDFANAVAEAEG